MDKSFRFAIMGAGRIAHKFNDAVKWVEGAEVAAIASKSFERAQAFAAECGIKGVYGDYEQMLAEEKPDCVYIATTTDAHYELTMLCLKHNVPVLCEKAMFTDSAQAKEAFAQARERKVFTMEAMWSRFLPAINQAKDWLVSGQIGTPVYADIRVGFKAPYDPKNRYYSPDLGGGSSYDVTVYCYEIATWMFGDPVNADADAVYTDTGVTGTDVMSLRFVGVEGAMPVPVNCVGSIMADIQSEMVIYGTNGRISIPVPQCAEEAYLYGEDGSLREHFKDEVTPNGFVYEAREAMKCVLAGKVESETVPHSLTVACAKLFDLEAAKEAQRKR